MKKTLVTLCVIAAIILMLTGCQKGTGNVVRYKGKDNIKKAIEQGEATEKYTADSEWKETIEVDNGKMTLNFDAKITLPEQDKSPIATVEAAGINQETVDKFINYFSEGKPVYEIKDDVVTKSEIEAEILRLKEGKDSDLKAEDPKAYEELVKPEIKELEKKYQTAPVTYERKVSDGKLKDIFTCEIDQKQTMLLKITNLSKGHETIEYKVKGTVNVSDVGSTEKIKGLKGVSISAENAQNQADKLITDLGFNEEYGLTKACSVYLVNGADDSTLWESPQGYAFYYKRKVNGVVSNLSLQAAESVMAEENDYAGSIFEEQIRIVIDDRGIIDFLFTTPMKQTKIETENVQLLPFSEIKEIAKKQMAYMGAYYTEELITHHTINIKEVKLGLARVLKKDNPNEYYLIPVWDFYGTDVQKYSEQSPGGAILDSNNESEEYFLGHSFLTINALDGSIIDRSKGY